MLGFVRARSTNEFDMYAKMKAKYPTWTKIMSSIAGSMEVNAALADFLVAIITQKTFLTQHLSDLRQITIKESLVKLTHKFSQIFQSLEKELFMRRSARSRMKSH